MQLYHSSVVIAGSVSDDPNTLSIFVNMLNQTQYNSEESRKSNITLTCKELKRD